MEDKKIETEGTAIIKYQTLTGQEVKLSPAIVKKYLVSGEGKVTDQEIMMFMALCKYQNLNPFLREAYLIKYGTDKATMVVGKETFLKRAVKNPKYQGHETGINEDGKKAWAKVYVKDYVVPITVEVDYDEYVGRKSDGTINKIWKAKGCTMLKKVALVQALREAFPEDFGGMYSPEEINTISSLPENPIDMPISDEPEQTKESIQPPQAKIKSENKEETTNKTITVGIKEVVVKTGSKDGKAWEKSIINAGEKEYNTFSKTIATDAKKASELGLQAIIEYKVTQYGNDIISLVIKEPTDEELKPKGEKGKN